MPSSSYGPAEGEREFQDLAAILGNCFAATPEESLEWIGRMGRENMRVLRRAEGVAGGLGVLPMGQWFGGRRVSMVGIGGVGVAPERRSRGVALELMRRTVREGRENGFSLSTLYPAAPALYRAAGYEFAGATWRIDLNLRELNLRDRELDVWPVGEGEFDQVKALYREWACRRNGALDRGPYVWARVPRPRLGPMAGYFVGRDGRPEGYVYCLTKSGPLPGHEMTLHLSDLVATTPRAARRLLSFLGDHRSLAERATWSSGPDHPLLPLLPSISYRIHLFIPWMIRVLNVEKALTERGYPSSTSAELHLRVKDDPDFPDNNDHFILTIEGGQTRVERGGSGRFVVDARGLAPLYSSHAGPFDLRLQGHVEASPDDLETAAAIFSGPAPQMGDMF